MTDGYIIKLVRDGCLGLSAPGVRFETTARDTHVRLLRQKLCEEVGEYLTNPCAEELGDVYAVLRALAIVDLDETPDHVGRLALEKANERGGFEQGVVMVGEVLSSAAWDAGSTDA